MKVTVYYNRDNDDGDVVIGEKEYQALLQGRISEMREDKMAFNDWGDDCYSFSDAFDITSEEKAKILEEYQEYCELTVTEELYDDGWRSQDIEV